MTMLQAFILGAVQGLTEFLPISSDGHLLFVEHAMGLSAASGATLQFDIILHMGSLVAIIVCYRALWVKMVRSLFGGDRAMHRLIILLIIATIPGAVIGLLFKDVVATTLRDPMVAGFGFLLSACVLALADAGTRGHGERPTSLGSFFIGCAQACAILPGLSRSGSTIALGRVLGLSRSAAVDFSFLMAAPIIAGAGLVPLLDIASGSASLPPPTIVASGFSASLLTSMAAIQFLRLWVRRFSIGWFALYLVPLGVLVILFA